MKAANTAASLLLALFLSLTAALGIAAAVNTNSPPSLMSRADYLAALGEARDAGRRALGSCREVARAEERAVCRARARAGERIAAAELEAKYRGTIAAQARARAVQARAEHSVAEARRLALT
jgi:hypothetical protein